MISATFTSVRSKLTRLQERRQRYATYQQASAASDATQVSLTDPDCRSMPVLQGTEVGYNVQTTVDAKYKLIVRHEVTNAVTDRAPLARMATQAQQLLGVDTVDVVADVGYYDGAEVQACVDAANACCSPMFTIYTSQVVHSLPPFTHNERVQEQSFGATLQSMRTGRTRCFGQEAVAAHLCFKASRTMRIRVVNACCSS